MIVAIELVAWPIKLHIRAGIMHGQADQATRLIIWVSQLFVCITKELNIPLVIIRVVPVTTNIRNTYYISSQLTFGGT